MPGVADQIRKTSAVQQHGQRKQDMQELKRLVRENRLHEADQHQLEILRMAADLVKELNVAKPATTTDPAVIADAVKAAIGEALKNLTLSSNSGVVVSDPSRPGMRHVSLTELQQELDNVSVSHGGSLGEEKQGETQAADKLEKLRKIKGNG